MNHLIQKIYLLDVELPVVGGLEIASRIREQDDKSYIVFITAHPECKNDIFFSRLEAIDYVEKKRNISPKSRGHHKVYNR